MTKKSNTKAFTLIELLVVISIIALLLSILLPSLAKAKAQARRVVCATRIKSVQTASVLYAADDSKGRLPQGGYHEDGVDLDDSISLELTNYIKMLQYTNPAISARKSYRQADASQFAKEVVSVSDSDTAQIFMCPEIQKSKLTTKCDLRRLPQIAWSKTVFHTFGGGYIARIGYCYLGGFETNKWDFNQLGGLGRSYVSQWQSPKTTSDRGNNPLVTDRTRFVPAGGGWVGGSRFLELPHGSKGTYSMDMNIGDKYDPLTQNASTNIGLLDGSVTSKKLSETKARQTVQYSPINSQSDLDHEDYTFF